MKTTVVLLGVLVAGWMTFDGWHAIVTGDYVTPAAGEYAGQLGPWAGLLKSIGLDPRSGFVIGIHIVLGMTWLVFILSFQFGMNRARTGLLVCAAASLWYLPFGTILGMIQIILLRRLIVRGKEPS